MNSNDTSAYADAFERAAAIIDERGWWNGDNKTANLGRQCIFTALMMAVDESGHAVHTMPAVDLLRNHLGVSKDDGLEKVWAINDQHPVSEGFDWAKETLLAIADDIRGRENN